MQTKLIGLYQNNKNSSTAIFTNYIVYFERLSSDGCCHADTSVWVIDADATGLANKYCHAELDSASTLYTVHRFRNEFGMTLRNELFGQPL